MGYPQQLRLSLLSIVLGVVLVDLIFDMGHPEGDLTPEALQQSVGYYARHRTAPAPFNLIVPAIILLLVLTQIVCFLQSKRRSLEFLVFAALIACLVVFVQYLIPLQERISAVSYNEQVKSLQYIGELHLIILNVLFVVILLLLIVDTDEAPSIASTSSSTKKSASTSSPATKKAANKKTQ
eukprot:TRINITY_DN10307_c0_g1_i1.p1 TRINITY_DN10307_c0_g1~~TRINITY_DN10307_c0_g1_i1.p1  ORF type:complete len:181 (-),score=46.87 TRINITY_DN10307_c0_g1_i1:86-628(-)